MDRSADTSRTIALCCLLVLVACADDTRGLDDPGGGGGDRDAAGADDTGPGPDAGPDAAERDQGSSRQDAQGGDLQPPVDGGGAPPDLTIEPDGPADAGEPQPVPECLLAAGADRVDLTQLEDGAQRASVRVVDAPGCRRTFALSTNAPLRGDPPANPRSVVELAGQPSLQTRNPLFDSLYALALLEVRDNSVDSINNGAFDHGRAMPCPAGGCFETGREWTYVWTRDTAYAVDLGLAALDPTRSRNSLDFKLSERREGGDLQIVQDTGSGGSYPVSTDRVVWALGAWEVLQFLAGRQREDFAERVWAALTHTAEHDRAVAWDPSDGLYRGEQSFLDWREQSYPEWTATHTVHIGMSKSLSTNAGHLELLQAAAALAAERGDAAAAARYGGWAELLREAMRARLWLEEEGLFSSFVTTHLDPAPARRWDLLGESLAVLSGAATPAQAARIVSSYPHLPRGAPVLWPQQQRVPIYHNRALWPFVTAYWIRAARAADNAAAVVHGVHSLVRGSALNLSNMENYEAVSGAAELQDGQWTGPVVNSRRQLWSVAGYVSMVHQVLFGLQAGPEGLGVAPYVPAELRRTLLANADSLVLNGFPYRGHAVTVEVLLPPADDAQGAYAVASVELNGTPVGEGPIPADRMAERNLVRVRLGPASGDPGSITLLTDTQDYRQLFGPRTPRISGVAAQGGDLLVSIEVDEDPGAVVLSVYRDGARVADDLPGGTTTWRDPVGAPADAPSHCYAVEATFVASGTHSQHSEPWCWWGPGYERVQVLGADAFVATGGGWVHNHGRDHYENWGDPGHSLTVERFVASRSGPHLLQLTAGNGSAALNTGVTCGVKRLTVYATSTGEEVGTGYALMPALGVPGTDPGVWWERWADSSFVPVELQSGHEYRIVVDMDERAVNMSAFAHFERYTGGAGGADGPFYRVNVAELKVLSLRP